jgi:putative transposase
MTGKEGLKGRKRHILVDTEGFVLRAKVHSAKVMDYEGIKSLLGRANTSGFPVCGICGWTLATEERTRAPTGSRRPWALERGSHRASEEARPRRGVDEVGEGMGQRGRGRRLAETDAARRVCGVAEEVGSGADDRLRIDQNRRMSKDYERLCASGEALVYAAMIRLMTRRLVRV